MQAAQLVRVVALRSSQVGLQFRDALLEGKREQPLLANLRIVGVELMRVQERLPSCGVERVYPCQIGNQQLRSRAAWIQLDRIIGRLGRRPRLALAKLDFSAQRDQRCRFWRGVQCRFYGIGCLLHFLFA